MGNGKKNHNAELVKTKRSLSAEREKTRELESRVRDLEAGVILREAAINGKEENFLTRADEIIGSVDQIRGTLTNLKKSVERAKNSTGKDTVIKLADGLKKDKDLLTARVSELEALVQSLTEERDAAVSARGGDRLELIRIREEGCLGEQREKMINRLLPAAVHHPLFDRRKLPGLPGVQKMIGLLVIWAISEHKKWMESAGKEIPEPDDDIRKEVQEDPEAVQDTPETSPVSETPSDGEEALDALQEVQEEAPVVPGETPTDETPETGDIGETSLEIPVNDDGTPAGEILDTPEELQEDPEDGEEVPKKGFLSRVLGK